MIDDSYGGTSEHFDFGRVLSRIFSVIGRNFMPFFVIALILEGIPTFLMSAAPYMALGEVFSQSGFIKMLINDELSGGMITLLVVGGIVGFVLYLLVYLTLQGTLIHASVEDFKGENVSIRESLSIGWRFALPLLGFSILSSLGIGLGLVLLIVPGILLICMWMVGAASVVLEGGGVFNAFGRSVELTKGYKWWILLILIVYFIAVFFITVIGELFAIPLELSEANIFTGDSVGTVNVIIYSLIQALVAAATILMSSAGVASLYYELRGVKEGGFKDNLAAVFD